MKRIFISALIILLTVEIHAQINKYGVPVIKSFSTQVTPGSEQNWWITKDKFGSVYFANDDKGVICYNGTSWSSIPVRNNARIRSLGCDKDGIIYVACEYEFGYIAPDENGKLAYTSLSQRYDKQTENKKKTGEKQSVSSDSSLTTYIGQIFSLAVNDTSVFYLSDEALFVYNIRNQKLMNYNMRELGFRLLVRIFNVNDRIIMADNLEGLLEFKDGKVIRLPGGNKFGGKICLSILPFSKNRVVIGTLNAGIFLYDYSEGKIDDKWVDNSVNKEITQIYCGAKLVSGEYIFGTIGEGVFVVDKSGKLVGHWTSSTTNMEDNLTYALYSDSLNNEVWIATYGYISKAYVNLPFTQFSKVNGIDHGVNGICEMDANVYVSHDKGVYKSINDANGIRHFVEIKGITDQVFPIIRAEVDNEKFILAGASLVLYKIGSSGKADTVAVNNPNEDRRTRSALSARCITQSKVDPHRFYLGTASDGIIILEYKNRQWHRIRYIKAISGTISWELECDNGDLLALTDSPNALYRIKLNDTVPVKYGEEQGLPKSVYTNLGIINDSIFLSTGEGLFKFLPESNKWKPCNEITGGYTNRKEIELFFQDKNRDIWIELNDTRYRTMLFNNSNNTVESYSNPLLLLPNLKALDMETIDNQLWMAISKNVYVLNKETLKTPTPRPVTMFTKIKVGRDSLLMSGTFFTVDKTGRRFPSLNYPGTKPPQLRYKLNSVSFYWATPYFVEEEQIQYSYKLEGFSNDWSKWENIEYKDFTNLPFGKYTFRVRAKTPADMLSYEAVFEFNILKPWYFTTVMIILYFIGFIVIIIAIIMAYTRKLKNENIRLEGIVAERTAVVVKQKEELESSIHYASRIQMALLPSEAILSQNLRNYFILFKPRDIVSGDFYWMTKKDERLYIVAADCTGHGVPGAFMSLLGMSFLDEIIDKDTAPRADQILSELRLHVTESLKQSGGDDEAKDGMDMALLVIDYNVSRVEFSGAYNPCFRVRRMTDEEAKNYQDENMEMADGSMSNGKYLLETIYASKMPIGISSRMDEGFVFYDWNLEKGVSYYLFSDGYIDQFGGDHGRKFMKKNFKKLILDIQDYPMNKQKELLEQNLKDWMGHSPQIDDILVMGLRTD